MARHRPAPARGPDGPNAAGFERPAAPDSAPEEAEVGRGAGVQAGKATTQCVGSQRAARRRPGAMTPPTGAKCPGCCLWHSQEWHRHRSHVCHAAGADHEVHHPGGHGRYHRNLWPGGGSPHCQLPE
ncbi:V-type proton ATPase 16 kDa proteolipid subunit c isoform X2 [Orcinus orca]|uniref:V-type proton ATPase 16 kDa proteolipid subunit c isoform X2 n=1 Tax=Orcinus orca TaxID=9733 RepID=UPI0014424374|nr:V-type proton ATPase 16 kDa proteolipid subunit c isoform X2 [Orcinus orca]